ncbi:MAG: hypothetical protein ACRDD8_00105 [Bacteroidales bacterium]
MRPYLALALLFGCCFSGFTQENKAAGFDNKYKNNLLPLIGDTLLNESLLNSSSFIEFIDKSSLLEIQTQLESVFILPNDTSYFMRRAMLWSMLYNKESQRIGEEYRRMFNQVMTKPFLRELQKTRPAVIYSGCLDPIELIRSHKQAKRAEKAREVIAKLNRIEEKDSLLKRIYLIENASVISEALEEIIEKRKDTTTVISKNK